MKALREIAFLAYGSTPRFILGLALAIAAGPTPAHAAEVAFSNFQTLPIELDWTLHPRNCDPGTTVKIYCGEYGTFLFSESSPTTSGGGGLAPCPTVVGGSETPGVYPMPVAADPLQMSPAGPLSPSTPFLSLTGGIQRTQAGAESNDTPQVPCHGGSCFGPIGGVAPSFHWAATIDWNNEHGWTTGFTVSQVSGMPTHMFALDDPDLTDLLGAAVGDSHVLASLCAIAEAVDRGGAAAPEIISMSFGRLYDPVDDDTADGGRCHGDREDTLTCQLSQVIHHLSLRGITFVAAAGNHGNLLFPAAHEKVVPAGSLNLAKFGKNGSPAKSWETPQGTSVLFPGYGICLAYGDDERRLLYPAAAGTSYSAAIYSGWLAHALARDPAIGDPLVGSWYPVWSDEQRCFVLSQSSGGGCNVVANEILNRTLGRSEDSCWASSVIEPALGFRPPQAGPGPVRRPDLPTLDEWVDETHLPTPGGNGCGPCAGGDENSLVAGSTVLAAGGGLARLSAAVVAIPLDSGNINIDTRAAWILDEGLSYSTIYFRVGEDYYPLLDRASGQGAELDQFASGEIDSLNLLEFRSLVRMGQQPSLVFVVYDERMQGQEGHYQTSTPLLILNGPSRFPQNPTQSPVPMPTGP